MGHRVELRPQARRDLREAAKWYADQRPGLDQQLRTHLSTLLGRIAEFPELFPRAPIRSVHRAPAIGPFPYSVYYRQRGEVIEVLAILHNARNPEVAFRRMR